MDSAVGLRVALQLHFTTVDGVVLNFTNMSITNQGNPCESFMVLVELELSLNPNSRTDYLNQDFLIEENPSDQALSNDT
uniref:Integrin_alpha2 domain-containing protein n=1 Tax=Steinernema glaseri TaxID=37863 RepID=A0A1I7YX31_9BILA